MYDENQILVFLNHLFIQESTIHFLNWAKNDMLL